MQTTRDASFDYCFNYFQSFREQGNSLAIAAAENIERSCAQLGFFLASWGMYRGNTTIFKHSSRFLLPMVQVIANANPEIWETDIDRYDDKSIGGLVRFAELLREGRGWMTDTLVTKIMLGVFGNVPAFDRVFLLGCARIKVHKSFGEQALYELAKFTKIMSRLSSRLGVPHWTF